MRESIFSFQALLFRGVHFTASKRRRGKPMVRSIPRRERPLPVGGSEWWESDGVIFCAVTSNGWGGSKWLDYFSCAGTNIGDRAKAMLLSPEFVATIRNVRIIAAILRGSQFSVDNRTTKNIRAEAKSRAFGRLPTDAACLIRGGFTDEVLEKMGLGSISFELRPITVKLEHSGNKRGDVKATIEERFDRFLTGRIGCCEKGNWIDAYPYISASHCEHWNAHTGHAYDASQTVYR